MYKKARNKTVAPNQASFDPDRASFEDHGQGRLRAEARGEES